MSHYKIACFYLQPNKKRILKMGTMCNVNKAKVNICNILLGKVKNLFGCLTICNKTFFVLFATDQPFGLNLPKTNDVILKNFLSILRSMQTISSQLKIISCYFYPFKRIFKNYLGHDWISQFSDTMLVSLDWTKITKKNI